MLVLDIFQNHKGDIAVQYNPKKPESIGRLREWLGNYMIENPLVTFSKRYKISYYEKASEDYVQTDAWICDTMGEFWKDSEKDLGQPAKNVFTILARLSNAYLSEHEELLRLREEVQHQSCKRENKNGRSRSKKSKKDVDEASVEDFSDYGDLDENAMLPTDYYAFGVGLCCSKYSEYLSQIMHIPNDINMHCYDEGSDEGIVSYMFEEQYRQKVTVVFTNDEHFTYQADIFIDTLAYEDFEPEKFYDELVCRDRRIRIPFTGGSVIEPVLEKIEGPVHLCIGVRLLCSMSFDGVIDEIPLENMRSIFNATSGMLNFINDSIKEFYTKI